MTIFTKANALFSIIGLFEEAQLAHFPGNCWKIRLDFLKSLGQLEILLFLKASGVLLIHQRS